MPITRGAACSGQRSYPDRNWISCLTAGVCVLASVMAHVDVTAVSRATHLRCRSLGPPRPSAWTTGYMLALHTVILTAGWAADRFGTRRLSRVRYCVHPRPLLCAVAPNILLLIIFPQLSRGFGAC